MASGDVQETFRCCTEGCGLVGNIGGRWTVGVDDLGGLFQPWWFYDSQVMIPVSKDVMKLDC